MPPASVSNCLILASSGQPVDTLSLAVDSVPFQRDPFRYPTEFGRLLYAQLFENLFEMDCDGRQHPALAVSWERLGDGRRWRFKVADGLSLENGSQVTATLVAERLSLNTFDSPSIDSIRASRDGDIYVYLPSSTTDPPPVLASPRFAVAVTGSGSGGGIVLGTGAYSVSKADPFWGVLSPILPGAGPVLRVDAQDDGDQRDLVDRGVDLMITRNTDVIQYAETVSGVRTVPLPFDKVYAVLSTTRYIESGAIEIDSQLPDDDWQLFAEEAIRADTRPPAFTYWWARSDACNYTVSQTPTGTVRPRAAFYTSGQRRIAYDNSDPIARDIAQRIVAVSLDNQRSLAVTDYLADQIPGLIRTDANLTSAGLALEDLESSLRIGNDFAYIIPLTIKPHEPCANALDLLRLVPWLGSKRGDLALSLLPIVETRSYLIARDNHPELALDWFGNIIIGHRPVK